MYKNQLKLKIHESRSGYLRRKERNANEQKKDWGREKDKSSIRLIVQFTRKFLMKREKKNL